MGDLEIYGVKEYMSGEMTLKDSAILHPTLSRFNQIAF